jgi:hypothetical protein
MLAFTSIKRSPPMTQEEASHISKAVHLFGYEPQILPLNGHFHLMIRGDGADDLTVERQLTTLRG